ncbi:hypothetical protein JKF63_00859 [Porcisia hertigi]|uniref:Mkiaa0324 protein-like protein n=1 Tax=Porcisia hertigi TaxID=2761500 RepID=A0A836GZ28_9TRYP|nr:hypothetical protein JKF63_00859 [Porcisia hertigi]
MFRRSAPALVRRRPPFASFFKALNAPICKKEPSRIMQTAAVLWRRTAPQYGRRYCAPRVTAALSVFRRDSRNISKEVENVARRVRNAGAASSPKPLHSTTTRRKVFSVKRSQQPKKKGVQFFAAFQKAVMQRTKLPLTEANRKRVLRMWVMTRQQRSLSSQKRVDLAVRLLNKSQKRAKAGLSRKLSKRIIKRRITRAINKSASRSKNRASRKMAKSTKPRTTSRKLKKTQRVPPIRKAAVRKPRRALRKRAVRMASKRRASAKASIGGKVGAKLSTQKQQPAKRTKTHKKHASRKTAAAPAKRVAPKLRSAKLGMSKPQRIVATSSADAARRRRNPYIRFYRHMCMTGLIPNHPRRQASRQIKALWIETHSLRGLNQRIARATELLEKRTGSKSMIGLPRVSPPTHGHRSSQPRASSHAGTPAALKGLNLSTLREKDIKVPQYYNRNPFGATYAALLPVLKDVPSSTRMAQVAKAWTLTSVKDDKRGAKARIAAVAEAMKK